MSRMRAGAKALLLTAGTAAAVSGAMGSASAASKPAPAPAPVVAPMSPAEAFVTHAYFDIVNAPADPGGKAYWIGQVDKGVPHANIAAALAQTQGHYQLLVQEAFSQIFGHNPDPSSVPFWTNYVKVNGYAQFSAALIGTPEFTSPYVGGVDAFVKQVYRLLLGREADPAGEAFWVNRLSTGDPMWHVAASIAHTMEWARDRVSYDYIVYHVGVPDQGGLDFWAGRLMSGMPEWQLVAALVGSSNYQTWAQAH
jgi:hypothetical protein